MKGDGLKELEKLVHDQKRKRYPNVKDDCLPMDKFTDKNTNGLTKAVVKCFEVHGFFATRIDSKGTYNQHLKRFIPSTQKKGLPDIFAQVINMPPIWVEIKCAATGDRLKPHQEETIQQLRNSGAMVFIATEFESFYKWFKETIINKTIEVCQ